MLVRYDPDHYILRSYILRRSTTVALVLKAASLMGNVRIIGGDARQWLLLLQSELPLDV